METNTDQLLLVNSNSYDFRSSFIYKYLKWSFQYVDNRDCILWNKGKALIYFICQMIVLCLGWSYFCYECYHGFKWLRYEENPKPNLFDFVIYLVYYVVLMSQRTAIQTIGFFTLKKNPLFLQAQIADLQVMASSTGNVSIISKVQIDLKNSQRKIYDIMAASGAVMLLFPLLTSVSLEVHILGRPSYPMLNTIRLFAYFILQLLSLPFLYCLLFMTKVQRIHLHTLFDIINRSDQRGSFDIFSEYKKIHKSIAESSKTCSLYLVYLIISVAFLFSVGTYTAAASVIVASKAPMSAFAIWDLLSGISIFITQTAVVFLLPLVFLAKVGTDQRKIVSRLLNLDPEQAKAHSLHHITYSIDLLQRVEGVGYKVFNSPITQWKTIIWLLIGPFVKILLSKVL